MPNAHMQLHKTLKSDAYQLIEDFNSGDLSLGQLSKKLQISQHETIGLLDSLKVAVADYDLAEDLAAVDVLLSHVDCN